MPFRRTRLQFGHWRRFGRSNRRRRTSNRPLSAPLRHRPFVPPHAGDYETPSGSATNQVWTRGGRTVLHNWGRQWDGSGAEQSRNRRQVHAGGVDVHVPEHECPIGFVVESGERDQPRHPVSQTTGKVTASLSWNDGYYANRYSWLSGSLTYANGPHAVVLSGMVNLSQTAFQSLASPLQNNSRMWPSYMRTPKKTGIPASRSDRPARTGSKFARLSRGVLF